MWCQLDRSVTTTLSTPSRRSAPRAAARHRPGAPGNGLALGDLPGVEQVELDFPHDVGYAGLALFPCREVAGFPLFPGAVAVGPVPDAESGHEDLQQERGDGEF